MKNLFLPKELENQLKQKGFNETSILPDGSILYQQVTDWFREKFGWNIQISGHNGLRYQPDVWGLKKRRYEIDLHNIDGSDYYNCLNKTISELIKLI